MKILHIHTTLSSGGIEAIICSLANEQSKEHDVSVCTIFEPKKNDVFFNRLSPTIKRISLGKKRTGFSLSEIFKIYRTIKSGNFDIVNIHGCFYYYIFAVFLLYRKTKFCYTVHSLAEKENASYDKYLYRIKRFVFKKKILNAITISREAQISFENYYHAPNHLIYNGISVPQCHKTKTSVAPYRFTNETKTFIHPGRITEAKNQIELCKAFSSIIQRGYDVALLICGKPEDENILSKLKPYFNDRIVYLGERNDIADLMNQCDAFVLPSIWEGMPVTLLEAMALGCVPICTRVGGIADVIEDGKNGLLISSPAADSIAATIKRFLSLSIPEIETLRQNALNSFKRFEIKNAASEYIKLYQSIIDDCKIGHDN